MTESEPTVTPLSADAPTVAVVLAGGMGTRMRSAVPKQLLDVGGRPVIGHTLAAFEAASEVDEILVVMAEGHHEAVRAITRSVGISKLADVIAGGAARADSSRAAVRWIAERVGPDADCKVLLHDAARMLVTKRIVAEVAAALDVHGAVSVAVPCSDTIVEVRSEGGEEFFAAVPERARLRRVQTPQGFRLSVIQAAYAAADADPNFGATDDCSVVLRFLPHVPVRVVDGDERNLKVTEPIDLLFAEALLRQ